MMSLGFDMILKHLVSSANKNTQASVTCNGKSLMNAAKRSGPSILPCGTPERTGYKVTTGNTSQSHSK